MFDAMDKARVTNDELQGEVKKAQAALEKQSSHLMSFEMIQGAKWCELSSMFCNMATFSLAV